MAFFNRCPECAFTIGKYIEFIDAAKQAIYKEKIFNKSSKYAEYDPEKMIFNSNITPNIEKLYDACGIENRCCRMHISSKTEFDKEYK